MRVRKYLCYKARHKKNLISPSGMPWKVSNNNTKISTFSYQPLLTTSDLLAC